MTAIRLSVLSLILLLGGCGGTLDHRRGMDLIREGKPEEGLDLLVKAVNEEPTDAKFRTDLYLQRGMFVERALAQALSMRAAGRSAQAEALYRRVLVVDPVNGKARVGLDELTRDKRHEQIVAEAKTAMKAGDTDKASLLLRPVLAENPEARGARELMRELQEFQVKAQSVQPTLKSSYTKPINLEFRDANVRVVFQGLAGTTGINFILDKDVRSDLRTTIFLKNASIDDAIDLILQTSQLQRKILNSNTVLIYPNTSDKNKDYQELVVKAFYLQSADVKQVQNTMRTLLKTKDMVIDEKLNLLVMRDTPDAIRLAEKLVMIHDLAEPEVMLDVEVLEIQRSRLLNLGIQWPTQLTLTPLTSTAGGKLRVEDLRNLNDTRLGAMISDTVINVRQDNVQSNLLANPRIRARNREKAKILIGDKVPVVTATTTATGIVSDSVQYLDVGLKLDVEPDIHLQDDVAIKIGMEVSSIAKQITTPNGSLAYQIGTRNASTVLRLKDGETQLLAGLISDQDRASGSGVPGLIDLPILGRLFSGQLSNGDKTEIVLSITPHIVRNVTRPDAAASEFWSGTESALRLKPVVLNQMLPGPENPSEGREQADARPRDSAKEVALSWQGPAQVKVGETFKVSLRMKSDGVLNSLPLQASFDATVLQAVHVAEGDFFKRDGGRTTFSTNIDPAGKLLVTAMRSDSDGAYGEDSVAIMTMRALAPKAPTEIKLLSAAPLIQDGRTPMTLLPPPYALTIVP